jgi:hypothetical protein
VADLHDRGREATDIDHDLDGDSAESIDFSQVHADDAFLDALGAAEPDQNGDFADDKLAALLLSWRHDVDEEPIHELVDPKLAVVTVRAARMRQRRGARFFAPLAAAAAILAIAFAGVGLAARDAQPGDTLWGLTRVLYADHARSVEAAAAVRTDLREAEEALANGKVAEAKSMLDEARHALPVVASEDGKDDLQAQHAALVAQLPDKPAGDASPPPNPAPTTAPGTSTSDPAAITPVNPPVTSDPPPTNNPSPTTDPSPTTSTSTQTDPGGGRVETTPNNVPNEKPQGGETIGGSAATNPASTLP